MELKNVGLLSFNETASVKEIIALPDKQPTDVKKTFSPLFAQTDVIKITNAETEEATDLKGVNKHEWVNDAKTYSNGRLVDILENLFTVLYNLNNKEAECEKKDRPGDFTGADIKLKSDVSCKIGVIYDNLKRRAKEDPVKLYSQLNNEKKFEKLFDIILVGSAQFKNYNFYIYKGKKFVEELGLSMARTLNVVYGEHYRKYSPALESVYEEYKKEIESIYEKQNKETNLDPMTRRAKYKELADITKAKYSSKIENMEKEYSDKVYKLGIYYGRLIGAFYARVFDKVSPDTPLKISYEAIKASTTLKIKKETPDVEAGVEAGPAKIKIKPQDKVSLEVDVVKLIDSVVMQLEHKKKCDLIKEYGLEKPLTVINVNMSDKETFDRGFYEGFKEYTGSYVEIVEESKKK